MKQKAFTLLEILLVIAAIGILAAIVIIAINPQRQLAQVRNAQRQSDINTLYKALEQYLIEEESYPFDVSNLVGNTSFKICATSQTASDCENNGFLSLESLVPQYLAQIPSDPTASGMNSGYYVIFDYVNQKIGIQASSAELEQDIIVGIPIDMTQYGLISDNSGIDCKDILNNQIGDTASGTYWIRLNDPSNPFRTYCDMEYDGGGWTLSWSGREGQVERVIGEVLRNTSTRMSSQNFQTLATLSSQIHIRTQDDLTKYVTSTPNSLPIQNLRNGNALYTSATQDSLAHWTGTMLSSLPIGCAPSNALLYHACGNNFGLHLFSTGLFTWSYGAPPSQENIEVYLR